MIKDNWTGKNRDVIVRELYYLYSLTIRLVNAIGGSSNESRPSFFLLERLRKVKAKNEDER